MEMTVEQTERGIKLIKLSGRLDIAGTQEIELKFTGHTAAAKQSVILDFSKIEYISSIGIRLLLSNATALGRSGAILVLLNPNPQVEQILNAAGMLEITPVVRSIVEAQQRILYHSPAN